MRELNAYLDGGPLRGQTFQIPDQDWEYFQTTMIDDGNTGWVSVHNTVIAVPMREVLHVYWRSGERRDGMRVYQYVRSTHVQRDEFGKVVSGQTVKADGSTSAINRGDLTNLGETIETRPR